MKHWILALAACGAVAAIPACSSDDSGGGSGGNTSGGTGGIVTGGSGGITGGSGGVTGGTGGNTGGTGNTGTGGSSSCDPSFQGQPCSALTSPDATQNACIHGDCCDALTACLADADCSSFFACGSNCLNGGGSQQDCSSQCQPCISSQGSVDLYNAFGTCMQTCIGGPGDSGTGGTAGSPGDAAAD